VKEIDTAGADCVAVVPVSPIVHGPLRALQQIHATVDEGNANDMDSDAAPLVQG